MIADPLYIQPLPLPFSPEAVKAWQTQWREMAPRLPDADLARWLAGGWESDAPIAALLTGIAGDSPYLSRLLALYPETAWRFALDGPDAVLKTLTVERAPPAELTKRLRVAKGKLALLTALADLSGKWDVTQVTSALSGFAGGALSLAVDALLAAAHARGEIALPDVQEPSRGSGLIVIGMGKLGAAELNYSSDIDLILFYEPARMSYRGRYTEQHFMNRLAHDLVALMQERTAQGYVFRTDLRLRPDPASTPPVIATDAAYYYYESVGQNWERAAMIKARPVAGDIGAGERFLTRLRPFVWRRHLDFAAINDIHSIKRQMDSVHNSRSIELAGHNVKLGRGGIREIEFYAQIHQLIWGGRHPALQQRETCVTLGLLAQMGLIEERTAVLLGDSYRFLRRLEHRLQMVADEQTHEMPHEEDGLRRIGAFMGYADFAKFELDVLSVLSGVHEIYSSSFRSADVLGETGNLVFTGVSHDPETLQTLRGMGFTQPESVSENVMAWHRGSVRAMRSARARELLTELMPLLLGRLGETANPDAAFQRFGEFLTNLPAGVQLFSLFQANTPLLALIADIMGSAPALAAYLSRNPALLESVLSGDFYDALPDAEALAAQLAESLPASLSQEDTLDALRRFRHEKQFQAGIQMLRCQTSPLEAQRFLSDVAQQVLAAVLALVQEQFRQAYGVIAGASVGVLALGKLGSRELAFGSDIDLVFVYDATDAEAYSDGPRGFTASVYFNRLAQRVIGALTAMGKEGRLYEVDTRLRPSGEQGMLAVSLTALRQYFAGSAWTFEYMAFAKARPVCGDGGLQETLTEFCNALPNRERDKAALRGDVADMRRRMEKEHPGGVWDIKHVRGGLIDLDFMAQYLLLREGGMPGSTPCILGQLSREGRLDNELAKQWTQDYHFLNALFHMLRLSTDRVFEEAAAHPGLRKLLAEAMGERDFDALKARLLGVEVRVLAHYVTLLES